MAQYTFTDGEVLTASLTNQYLMGEGGAWTSWTPVVTQSASVTVTNTRSVYARYGRTIHFSLDLAVTGTGTAANAVVITLPVTAAAAGNVTGITGYIQDSSVGDIFTGIGFPTSTTTFRLRGTQSATGIAALGAVWFTAALASGDTIRCSGTYEAAS
jgi:hypothetical protein